MWTRVGNYGRRAINGSCYSLAIAGGILVVVIGLITAYEVVMRYVFNNPTIWVQEVSNYLLLGAMFFGVGWTMLEDGHVNVDFLTSRLSKRKQAAVNSATALLALAFLSVFTWKAYELFLRSYNEGWRSWHTMAVILWPSYLVIPVSWFFLCLAVLVKLRGHMTILLAKNRQ